MDSQVVITAVAQDTEEDIMVVAITDILQVIMEVIAADIIELGQMLGKN